MLCVTGSVLESVVSGVFPWVVSGGECCVLVLEVCVSKLWLERDEETEADPVCFVCVY